MVAFPPDTDTKGFAAENIGKPPETIAISKLGGLYKPASVAATILNDISNKRSGLDVLIWFPSKSYNWKFYLKLEKPRIRNSMSLSFFRIMSSVGLDGQFICTAASGLWPVTSVRKLISETLLIAPGRLLGAYLHWAFARCAANERTKNAQPSWLWLFEIFLVSLYLSL